MIQAFAQWSNREKVLLTLLLLAGVVGGIIAFPASYFSNSNVIIGLLLFPFTLFAIGPNRNNSFFLVGSILFVLLACAYGVRIFFFFGLAFYFLWIFELFIGRVNYLVLFAIIFMSPFFLQVVTILGFPIRLTLSDVAGQVLHIAGVDVSVQGNLMVMDGSTFSVDEACMGLNMLAMSMLLGVFLLAFRYRVSRVTLGLCPTVIFFLVAFALNLITNVIRIVILVYFQIPPENPLHEFLGIVCLIVYVAAPLHFFSAWLVSRYGQPIRSLAFRSARSGRSFLLVVPVCLFILFAGTAVNNRRHAAVTTHPEVRYGLAKSELLDGGVTKVLSGDILMYVKLIPEFFTGEHTPLMCWKGSGYEFAGVATTVVADVVIYKGTLVKDGQILHTAWWYSDGDINTISQVEWRLRMVAGQKRFCLINVTSTDEQALMESIYRMFTTNALAIKS